MKKSKIENVKLEQQSITELPLIDTTSCQPFTKPHVSYRTVELEDDVVIVVDNSNYKASYAEEVPFKAKVERKYDNEIIVKSLKTGKEYELYYTQILEALDIEEIVKILDLSKYGI